MFYYYKTPVLEDVCGPTKERNFDGLVVTLET